MREFFEREMNNLNKFVSLLNRPPLKEGVQDTWR